jgi:hypothetical protein
MKKIINVLCIVFLFTSIALAQTQPKADAKMVEKKEMQMEEATGPQMTFENKVVDYGTVEKGSEPLRKFHFTNTGIAPLVIKQAKGSCGCTVPDYPKEPIMPGATGVIDVRYDTNRIGPFTKTISLSTNVNDEKIVLTIKGKVETVPQDQSVPAKKSIF